MKRIKFITEGLSIEDFDPRKKSYLATFFLLGGMMIGLGAVLGDSFIPRLYAGFFTIAYSIAAYTRDDWAHTIAPSRREKMDS